MQLTSMRVGVVSAMVAASMSAACGQENSYAGAEGALRDWLAAVEDGDQRACALETREYHEELIAESSGKYPSGTSCEKRVASTAAPGAKEGHPSPESEMDVPVWDPSGEALIEVTDARNDVVREYWMVLRGGRWLVAGDEP